MKHVKLSVALRAVALVSGLLLSLGGPLKADVLTVGPLPADHAQIQAAVDAASDGDVILVASGSYDAVTVVDKALTIVADAGANVTVGTPFTVRDLAASRSVVLRGLVVFDDGDALVLTDNAGPVVAEDCQFVGPVPGLGEPGAQITNCDAVTFTRCSVQGAVGSNGADAIVSTASDVTLQDCELQGGAGGDDSGFPGGSGGDGLEVNGGRVLLLGTTSTPGAGGIGNPPGMPGFALTVISPESVVLRRDVTFVPGFFNGSPTPTILNPHGGTVQALLSASRSLTSNAPVREGETLDLVAQGEPGDDVFLWASVHPGFLPLFGYEGVFGLGLPVLPASGVYVGTLPVGSTLELSVPVPDLGGLEGFPVFVQPLVQDTSGALTLGSTSVTVLIDDAF